MNKKSLRARSLWTRRRTPALSAPEAQAFCDAYGIPTPKQALAKTAAEAVKIAARLAFPSF